MVGRLLQHVIIINKRLRKKKYPNAVNAEPTRNGRNKQNTSPNRDKQMPAHADTCVDYRTILTVTQWILSSRFSVLMSWVVMCSTHKQTFKKMAWFFVNNRRWHTNLYTPQKKNWIIQICSIQKPNHDLSCCRIGSHKTKNRKTKMVNLMLTALKDLSRAHVVVLSIIRSRLRIILSLSLIRSACASLGPKRNTTHNIYI